MERSTCNDTWVAMAFAIVQVLEGFEPETNGPPQSSSFACGSDEISLERDFGMHASTWMYNRVQARLLIHELREGSPRKRHP